MSTTIIITLQNPGAALLPMLQSLIATTPEDYDVVIVDRGSDDGTVAVLQALDGDLTIIKGEADLSLGGAVNRGLLEAKGDATVVATVNARFSPNWLTPQLAALTGTPLAQVPNVNPLDLAVLRTDVLSGLGGFDEAASDETVLAEYIERVRKMNQRAERVQSFNFPRDLIGFRTGESLAELLTTAEAGAKIGDLPIEFAERLRERLWQEEERRLLLSARGDRDVCWTDEGVVEPLITVRIVTHNRAEELMEIALPAALDQTYENLDIIVVGDHTDQATVEAMKTVRDPRVRFYNLPAPSVYPTDKWGWWLVHGSPAMNLGIELAEGSWITPADDDDAMTPDHVEVLLHEARARRLEFIWSQSLMKHADGWQIIGAEALGPEATTAGAVMWSSGLRFMRMSTTCWKFNEEHDQNMWRRMHEIGVVMGYTPKVTYRYFPAAR